MGRIYDLHCHSSASDGILRPHELVSRAKAKQVDVLALTDHDTLDGYTAASAAAVETGLELVCGVEFSSQWGKQGIHIVGLNLDPASQVLVQALARQQAVRESRGERIAEKLAKCGVEGALQGARRIANGAVLGRPHFARYLIEQGRAKSMNGAFKQYLGAGKPADVRLEWPEFDEVIGWITAAGGVAVLAHPEKYKMTRTKLRAMLGDFSDAGGRAVEVIAGYQTSQVTTDLARLAQRFELLASCGSDFHGPDQPWQELGAFGTLPATCQPVWHAWE